MACSTTGSIAGGLALYFGKHSVSPQCSPSPRLGTREALSFSRPPSFLLSRDALDAVRMTRISIGPVQDIDRSLSKCRKAIPEGASSAIAIKHDDDDDDE